MRHRAGFREERNEHVDEIIISLTQLRQMIGLRVRYRGEVWLVIEVIEDGPSLILETEADDRVVQTSQFGDGYRRSPRQVAVAVIDSDRRRLHPDFLAIDLE